MTTIMRLSFVLVLVLLGSCSLLPGFLGGGRSISRISITAEPGANLNSAIAVDLVMITSDDASAAIMKLSARDWFQQHAQFERDYPDDVVVMTWELAPGQIVRDARVDSPGGLRNAIIFANYKTDGDHRLRLGDSSKVKLVLSEKELRVEP